MAQDRRAFRLLEGREGLAREGCDIALVDRLAEQARRGANRSAVLFADRGATAGPLRHPRSKGAE